MTVLSQRKQKLLQYVIEQFVQTAEPIGSKFLAENSDLGVSGATLRNEMRDLEQAGYLTHPHTSAGRIPTEAGYRYYIDHLMQPSVLSRKTQALLSRERDKYEDTLRQVKAIAKYLAEYGGSAVIVAFDRDRIYYTGISHLFAQPEFRDFAQTMSVSSMFDQCEDRIGDLYDLIENVQTPQVVLGQNNPLGQACGAVIIPFRDHGLFTILGPMRMDYARVTGVLSYVQTLL